MIKESTQRKKHGYIIGIIIIIITVLAYMNLLALSGYKELQNQNVIYTVSLTGEKNELSQGTEARVLEICINGTSQNLQNYAGDYIFQDDCLVGYSGTLYVAAKRMDEVSIKLLKHPWSGIVKIEGNGIDLPKDLYSEADDSYLFQSTGITFEDVLKAEQLTIGKKILSFFILFIVVSVLILALTYVLNGIKRKQLKCRDIILSSFCLFILWSLVYCILVATMKAYFIIPYLISIILLLYYMRDELREKIEYAYIVIIMLVGIPMILLLPPGHVPDETSHFIKAYEISRGNNSYTTTLEGKEEQGESYIYLPKTMMNMVHKYTDLVMNSEHKYSIFDYYNEYVTRMDKDDVTDELFWFGNTIKLNKLDYIPAVIACYILNLVSIPAIVYFHLCRFFNLLTAMMLGYYTLKMLPKFKSIFLLIMLLPITVQQTIGINQDCITLALSFLLTALLMKAIYENSEVITKKSILTIVLVQLLLGFSKVGYFPIVVLAILIPREKFTSIIQSILMKACMILPIFISSGIQYITAASTIKSDGSLPYYSLSFIFAHPIKTAAIYINTLLIDGEYLLARGMVTGFGWYTRYAYNFVMYGMTACLLLLIISYGRKDEISVSVKERITYFSIAFIMCGFIVTSLFLGWTTIDKNTVQGLQPRYFIPAVVFIALGLQNNKINSELKNRELTFSIVISAVLCIGLYTITQGFYI